MTRALDPDLILLVDSTPFNGNAQHPERYNGRPVMTCHGFPARTDVIRFLQQVDVVICIETPYNFDLFAAARAMHKRVYLVINYEFWDALNHSEYPTPYRIIAPSPWRFDEVLAIAPTAVMVPPPLFITDFAKARESNFDRRDKVRKFIHLAGTPAVHDRAGTQTVLEALKYTSSRFELVVRSQKPLPYQTDDPRVTFDHSDPDNNADLYLDADCILHPRKYGGLNLIMLEGLMAGLPVVMPDISPNNAVLPADWLVPARKTGSFMARTEIDLYEADPKALAAKIDWFCGLSDMKLEVQKHDAYELAIKNYSVEAVKPRWEEVLNA